MARNDPSGGEYVCPGLSSGLGIGVRAEMTMPDDGDAVERTPVRGRV